MASQIKTNCVEEQTTLDADVGAGMSPKHFNPIQRKTALRKRGQYQQQQQQQQHQQSLLQHQLMRRRNKNNTPRNRRWLDENSNNNNYQNINTSCNNDSDISGLPMSKVTAGSTLKKQSPSITKNKRNFYPVDTGTAGRMRSPLTVNKNQDLVSADNFNYHQRRRYPQQKHGDPGPVWNLNNANDPKSSEDYTTNMDMGPQWIQDVNEFPQLGAAGGRKETSQSLCSWSSITSDSQSTTSASVSVVSDDTHLGGSPQSSDLEMSPSSKAWLQMCLEYSASANRSWVEELENEDNNDDETSQSPVTGPEFPNTGVSKTPRRRLDWENDDSSSATGPSPCVVDGAVATVNNSKTESVKDHTTNVSESTNVEGNADEVEVATTSGEASNGNSEENKTDVSENKTIILTDKTIKIRENLIDFAKNHWSYQNYMNIVPMENRAPFFPQTPDKNQVISRRRFDSQLKSWRRYIHKWDNYSPNAANSVQQAPNIETTTEPEIWESALTTTAPQQEDENTLTSAVNTMDTEETSCFSVMDTTEIAPPPHHTGVHDDESARDGFPECFSGTHVTGQRGDTQPMVNMTQASGQNPRSLFNLSPVNEAGPIATAGFGSATSDLVSDMALHSKNVEPNNLVINDDSMPSLF